jgi:hypothetical protein
MNAHHHAVYNGKTVSMDYFAPQRQFRMACRRIIDNGASGFVHCPDGKIYEVKQGSKLAKLVNQLEKIHA